MCVCTVNITDKQLRKGFRSSNGDWAIFIWFQEEKCAHNQLDSTNSCLYVLADTPPPAYMPPDEQLGQESQSMDTSSSLVPPNMTRAGEEYIVTPRKGVAMRLPSDYSFS